MSTFVFGKFGTTITATITTTTLNQNGWIMDLFISKWEKTL